MSWPPIVGSRAAEHNRFKIRKASAWQMVGDTALTQRKVEIIVYDDVEVLDFAGPFEVFSVADELHDHALYDVALVAEQVATVTAVNGLQVVPERALSSISSVDILVIPGGSGSKRVLGNALFLRQVRQVIANAEIVLSICSGARILAKLGLLDGMPATTHHQVFADLAELAPAAVLRPNERFVDTGNLITTGGITAGIDGALHLVARLNGTAVASATADYMEYEWWPDRNYRRD